MPGGCRPRFGWSGSPTGVAMWSCLPSRMLRLGGLTYVDPGSLDRFEEERQEERQAMLRQLDTEIPDRRLTVEDIMRLNRRPSDPNDDDCTPLGQG